MADDCGELLARALHHEHTPLPSSWADTLGVATVGEVRARLLRFKHDLRIIPHTTSPHQLHEVYYGDTGIPSADTLARYVATATRHLRDILREVTVN